MTVKEIMKEIVVVDGKVVSLSTGNEYEKIDFIDKICKLHKLNKSQKAELVRELTQLIKPQSDQSKIVENFINKYQVVFSNGVYFVNGEVTTLDKIYKLVWKEEKMLPTEVDNIMENVEKISEEIDLQEEIYKNIKEKEDLGKSKYLESLDRLYPDINFRNILYNILVPKTRPLFHIFYDDGVGGTGKSTLLEVITKIVGEKFVSNVLLDQFGNRFIFANMLGKYVNIGDDNGKNDELQNVGTLKSIITGNRVTIDRKNISPIEVRIFAKQLFATNILPYIDFTDGGIMRRLNIIPMNKVIPKNMEMCELNDEEIGYIIGEVLTFGQDIKENNNSLAITNSPIYRYITKNKNKNVSYDGYKNFCTDNGFRCMNIINFEVKKKFIDAYIKREKPNEIVLEEVKEELPF